MGWRCLSSCTPPPASSATSVADSIRTDIINSSNLLAVKLTSRFPTTSPPTQSDIAHRSGVTADKQNYRRRKVHLQPNLSSGEADVVKDLQQYAASIRDIDNLVGS